VSGVVPSSRLIDFMLRHGSIDLETLSHLFMEIEKRGGLTFQLLNWWLQPVNTRKLSAGQFNIWKLPAGDTII
jgi:hypothetical protein